MNSPVNRPSESPRSSEQPPAESVSETIQSQTGETGPEIPASEPSEPIADSDSSVEASKRQQPIPPPSHPRQYRAIGLVYGQYQRSEEQLTRGTIQTSDGAAIDAVILGRVISLVKNHLDLEKPHLWVVYPRTRQENDLLHVQIVGVWEPETLNQSETNEGEDRPPDLLISPEAGYFSVRGEVIFSAPEEQTIIIKIRQSPKKELEKPKFFKLKLLGTLLSRPVSRFWDLQVQLKGDTLVILEGLDLGFATKKKPFNKGTRKPFENRSRSFSQSPRPLDRERTANIERPTPRQSSPSRPSRDEQPEQD